MTNFTELQEDAARAGLFVYRHHGKYKVSRKPGSYYSVEGFYFSVGPKETVAFIDGYARAKEGRGQDKGITELKEHVRGFSEYALDPDADPQDSKDVRYFAADAMRILKGMEK